VVENLNNGKAVVVRINDRGPFIKGRIIDVSKAAASVLGMLGSGTARVKVSTSGGSSLKVAAKEESPVKVATATTKMETASGDKFAKVEDAPVKSAKMEGVSASKPVKVAAKAGKPAKVASASRGKSTKTAKASSKAAKIVTASAAKRSGKSETRVAGLMKSSRDIKRVASRAASRKTYAVASRSGSRKAVAVASRELGKSRRGQAKGAVVLASSANPYGAFVPSASFIN